MSSPFIHPTKHQFSWFIYLLNRLRHLEYSYKDIGREAINDKDLKHIWVF